MASPTADLVLTGCRLATAANAAYAGQVGPHAHLEPAADPDFASLALSNVTVFAGPRTDTHGYLAHGPVDRILAFRGSLTLPNWLINVSFDLVPWLATDSKRGKVHAGFAAAWKEVRDAVFQGLEGSSTNRAPVWITGHSLGGALAVLAAADLAHAGVPVAGVHVFGAPRVGDQAFCGGWSVPVERWVNHQDPVPLMPWSGPFMSGYVHVGRLHYLNAEGKLCTEASLWDRFCDQAQGLFTTPGPNLQAKMSEFLRARLADHDMGAYLRKVRGLAGS